MEVYGSCIAGMNRSEASFFRFQAETGAEFCLSGHFISLLPLNEHQVANVDQKAGGLSDDKHDILANEGVDQQQQASADAEIPEYLRNDALLVLLGMNPLDEKTHEEQELTCETENKNKGFRTKHDVHRSRS